MFLQFFSIKWGLVGPAQSISRGPTVRTVLTGGPNLAACSPPHTDCTSYSSDLSAHPALIPLKFSSPPSESIWKRSWGSKSCSSKDDYWNKTVSETQTQPAFYRRICDGGGGRSGVSVVNQGEAPPTCPYTYRCGAFPPGSIFVKRTRKILTNHTILIADHDKTPVNRTCENKNTELRDCDKCWHALQTINQPEDRCQHQVFSNIWPHKCRKFLVWSIFLLSYRRQNGTVTKEMPMEILKQLKAAVKLLVGSV